MFTLCNEHAMQQKRWCQRETKACISALILLVGCRLVLLTYIFIQPLDDIRGLGHHSWHECEHPKQCCVEVKCLISTLFVYCHNSFMFTDFAFIQSSAFKLYFLSVLQHCARHCITNIAGSYRKLLVLCFICKLLWTKALLNGYM